MITGSTKSVGDEEVDVKYCQVMDENAKEVKPEDWTLTTSADCEYPNTAIKLDDLIVLSVSIYWNIQLLSNTNVYTIKLRKHFIYWLMLIKWLVI